MSPDEPEDGERESGEIDADLASLLADPSLWDEPDPLVEDFIVAAIAAERSELAPLSVGSEGDVQPASNVRSISAARRWLAPIAAGVAAAAVILVGVSIVGSGSNDPGGIELALAATDLAPDAEGVVTIRETQLGTRLMLDVSGLPPAAPGQYYEAWLRTGPEVGVSAGTFHLRGGDGEVELWAGVLIDDYPLFTITVQDEADVESSGRVVLKGLVG